MPRKNQSIRIGKRKKPTKDYVISAKVDYKTVLRLRRFIKTFATANRKQLTMSKAIDYLLFKGFCWEAFVDAPQEYEKTLRDSKNVTSKTTKG